LINVEVNVVDYLNEYTNQLSAQIHEQVTTILQLKTNNTLALKKIEEQENYINQMMETFNTFEAAKKQAENKIAELNILLTKNTEILKKNKDLNWEIDSLKTDLKLKQQNYIVLEETNKILEEKLKNKKTKNVKHDNSTQS